MSIHKLTSTDAFVVFDLADAPASGVVRRAPKILQGGAQDLARSMTYTFASFEMERGGASAGINAAPDEADAAIAAFVDELTPMVADNRLSLDPGKGVPGDALAPLHAADDRHEASRAAHGDDELWVHLAGLGPVVAAEAAGIDFGGATVAIEGFGAHGPALAAAVAARGGAVTALATSAGSLSGQQLADPGALRERWVADGDAMVGDVADPAWKVFGAEVDVLFTGSKMGAINHETAAKLEVKAVVPHEPLPYTARALAVMQRRGIRAVPDFMAVAGPIFAAWPDGDVTPDAIVATASAAIATAVQEAQGHEDGMFLGACRRAEAFLQTWQDELPFGRPLAS